MAKNRRNKKYQSQKKQRKQPPRKYGTKKKQESKLAIKLEKIIFILLLIIMFYPVFLRGMYFENEQLWLEIFVFTLFAAFWVYKYIKREETSLYTPIDYAAISLVAVYLISLISAVSLRLALREWQKYCMYFAVFFMLSRLAYTHRRKMIALWVMLASGTGVCIMGLDGAAGGTIAKALNKFFGMLGADHDVFFGLYVDNRIHSTIQYPNALAGYLIMVFFIGIALIFLSKNIWLKALSGGILYLVVTVFFFTLSRGGFIVMAGALLLYLIALPKGSRVRGAVYAAAPLLVAGAVLIKMYGYITNQVTGRIFMAAAVGVVLSALLTMIAVKISPWFEKISWKVYAVALSAMVAFAIAGLSVVLSATEPLTIENNGQENTWSIHTKRLMLKPGEYELKYEVNAKNNTESSYAYEIRITSRNKQNILGGGSTLLESFREASSQGKEERTIMFTVPEGSEEVNIQFRNYYAGTSATFGNARIMEPQKGEPVKMLVLKYKYIPEEGIFNRVFSRFENLTVSSSNLARATFYRDGMKMFGDRWFLGAGGGAWSLLYFSYQSYLYWSSQAHNFWLQTAIETGILGIIALLFLVGGLVYMYFKQALSKESVKEEKILQAVIFTAVIAILVHSVIDFDLSLSAIALLMWQLLALFNTGFKGEVSLKSIKAKPILMVVLTAVLLLFPATQKYAQICAEKGFAAYNNDEDFEKGIRLMEKAVKADPSKPQYKIEYANMVIRQKPAIEEVREALRQVIEAGKQCGYDADLLLQNAIFHFRIGNFDGAMDAVNRSAEIRPLWEGSWNHKAQVHYQIAINSIQNQEWKKAEQMLDAVLGIPEEAKKVNRNNFVPFIFEPNTFEIIEKSAYLKEHMNSGETIALDDICFYSKPHMDINFDGVPDGWKTGNEDTAISFDDTTLTAEHSGEGSGYMDSRDLNLMPGKKYNIEIKVGGTVPDALQYRLIGIHGGWQKAELADGVFAGEFETGDNTDGRYYLRIRVEGKINIESILIVAEEN